MKYFLSCLVVACIGCGGSVQSGNAATDSGSGSADATTPTPDAVADTVIETGADTEAECTAAAAAIGTAFSSTTCTVTAHAHFASGAILGWAVACGKANAANETSARAAFAPYAGPYTPIDSYKAVGSPIASDEFVFYHPPSDFGGLGVVSYARTDVLLAAELAWMGPTKVTVPAAWRSADEVAARCEPTNFSHVRFVSLDGGPIDEAKAAPALAAVASSPLVRAIANVGHSIINVMVTTLPQDGGTGPSAEWVVFVNSAVVR